MARGSRNVSGAAMEVSPEARRFWTFLECYMCQGLNSHYSGQIIATSHDLTPNGGLAREIPLFQGNPGW